MCEPRNSTANSDANKRRKTAVSPYGDVDDRAEPPAKRGYATAEELVTANCTLSVPYADLTAAEAAVFSLSAEQAVAQTSSSAPADDTREYADEQYSTLADEEADMERLNRDVGLVSPNEERAASRNEYDAMLWITQRHGAAVAVKHRLLARKTLYAPRFTSATLTPSQQRSSRRKRVP